MAEERIADGTACRFDGPCIGGSEVHGCRKGQQSGDAKGAPCVSRSLILPFPLHHPHRVHNAAWRLPTANPSDFFNYGMTERAWKDYQRRVLKFRSEFALQSPILCIPLPEGGPPPARRRPEPRLDPDALVVLTAALDLDRGVDEGVSDVQGGGEGGEGGEGTVPPEKKQHRRFINSDYDAPPSDSGVYERRLKEKKLVGAASGRILENGGWGCPWWVQPEGGWGCPLASGGRWRWCLPRDRCGRESAGSLHELALGADCGPHCMFPPLIPIPDFLALTRKPI